jgi:hypothetical protein
MKCKAGTHKVGGRCVKSSTYEVVVGNIGTVYKGASKKQAWKDYEDYIKQSKSERGRASGEDVTILLDGEIFRTNTGKIPTYQEAEESEYGL